MPRLVSPEGTLITATLETLEGVCELTNPTRKPDGTFDFDYLGGTDIDWNAQKTAVRDGQRIFLDEDGEEWLERELQLVEDDEDGE